jgi:putative colanic acid biosynthesis acetyltransferase WcaF
MGQSDVLDARVSGAIRGGPNFTLAHRARRAAWYLTWMLLASWTPAPFHAWRRFLLRVFGAKVAATARIWGSTRVFYPPNLEMHDYAVLGWRVQCYNMAKITLEHYANVAQFAHLCAGSHDIDDPQFQLVAKPITIRSFAWIAADGFIGPGVTVEEGAVLGARGVTFRDLKPWTVYGGNPAKPIRARAYCPPP